ncbi:hypothetical protein CN941_09815 [Bacillus cereus]|nr:hypothetical protein CN941_09815 [Bacillus cereus]
MNSKAIKEVKEIELLEEYLHFEHKKIGTARIFNSHMADIVLELLSSHDRRFIHMLDEERGIVCLSLEVAIGFFFCKIDLIYY